jgi:hypothetical protein
MQNLQPISLAELAELEDEKVKIVVPPGQKWILKRAIELYRLWKEQIWELQLSKLYCKYQKLRRYSAPLYQ